MIVRKQRLGASLHPPALQPMALHSGALWSFEHGAGGHDPHSAPLPTGLAAHGRLMADACDAIASDRPRICPGSAVHKNYYSVCCHTYFYFSQNNHSIEYSSVNRVSCESPSNQHPIAIYIFWASSTVS